MSVVARALNLNGSTHQIGGIYSISDRIKNDPYTFRHVREVGPISFPILRAVAWITTNCAGWTVTADNLNTLKTNATDDLALLSTIRGMMKSFAYKGDAYIDELGKLRRDVVDAYELLDGLHVIADTPDDVDKVIKIEQILPFAHIRWPAYAVLWDAVHRHRAFYMGSIRPWVVTEIERLGLGIPTIGKKAPRNGRIPPGRPPVVILPTAWGIRLVQLADTAGDKFAVTDQMRQKSRRIQSSLVPKLDRIPHVINDRYLKITE